MTGYIYILTNPSFPQYVKIGYAADVKQRLAELSRSTAVPLLVKHLLNTQTSIAGPQYFKYNGEWLNVVRARLEGRE